MATSATLNRWLDELSSSIIRKDIPSKQTTKRVQDTFRRRVRKHNYARTNQFEVKERLDGLEEKFQILTLDNLSDALRQRRNELKEFEHHWLPDVLDLFLHLSGDPARNENLLELYRVPPRVGTPPPLRWGDLLAESPIDKHDRLWRVPDFRDADDSGYDEDFSISTSASTPSPKQRKEPVPDKALAVLNKAFEEAKPNAPDNLSRLASNSDDLSEISEEQFIREALFVLRGYSSRIFTFSQNRLRLNPAVHVRGLPPTSLRALVEQLSNIRQSLDIVNTWVREHAEQAYITAMKNAAEAVVQKYYKAVDELQHAFADPKGVTIVSIIRIMDSMELVSSGIEAISTFLLSTNGKEPIFRLETLYSAAQTYQQCGEIESYDCLHSLLFPSLYMYLQPIWVWLQEGQLSRPSSQFFVKHNAETVALSTMWHSQFSLNLVGSGRPPSFLINTAQQVLACGKTSAFLHRLNNERTSSYVSVDQSLGDFMEKLSLDSSLPFTASFEHAWQEHVRILLESRTFSLKKVFDSRLGFGQAFDGLSQIYLRQNSSLLDDIEVKLFDRIDRCIDSWNDRFQLRDMLEETFNAHGLQYMTDALTIHSAYTSSRTVQSRRTSVRILSSLAFEYNLAWPFANIIDQHAMTAYRRISLMLMQVRRAKYCLERNGYVSAMTVPLDENATPTEQKFAQILAFTLINFANTLYNHLTVTTIQPLTKILRRDMRTAATVDEMVEVHQKYITRLEFSCLTTPKVKVLRQTLITILDLCIRFSDLVSNPTKTPNADSDHEASSFISAVSRNRNLRADQYGSDSDGDDLGNMADGYSSFIVLEDDTTIVKELRKLQAQFKKQLKFFVAGLRGVGRAGQHVQDLESLADRLTWNLGN